MRYSLLDSGQHGVGRIGMGEGVSPQGGEAQMQPIKVVSTLFNSDGWLVRRTTMTVAMIVQTVIDNGEDTAMC